MKTFRNIFEVIVAVIAGESILVFLITIVQENLFGGISYTESPWFDIIFGGLGTFVSAFLAGVAAYLIVGKRTLTPTLIITCLILLESIWLLFFSGSKDPLWFDAMASSSLLVGIWLGVLVYHMDVVKNVVSGRKLLLEKKR